MQCPKCGSEINNNHLVSASYPIRHDIFQCEKCWIVFTDWQAKEIDSLREGLRKLEWSDEQWESRFCPVCEMEPHEGHKPDCWLYKLLEKK